MESLNISKLKLSSVRSHTSEQAAAKSEMAETRSAPTPPLDEDDYHCEYRDEIWQTLLEQDAEKPTIHLQSPQLEFRGTLVQQLRDVTRKLGLCLGTLHSAVALLDLFMDAHRLRADRLTHVALACLSLAAKSEDQFSRAPTLKILAKTSGITLCGKTFRQLEWMVGQHVRWRLLAPTPVAFASLLAHYVGTDAELPSPHAAFRARFRRDATELLNKYLDLTLSDVRLKVVESVEVGCACVACARADLGLCAWPAWLALAAQRPHRAVAPLARLLHRMMQILKSRETPTELDVDQGYSSAKTSPNNTPSASPASSCSSTSRSNDAYRQHSVNNCRLELSDNIPTRNFYQLPTAGEMTLQRADSHRDYRYCKSRMLIDASEAGPSSRAIKRGLDPAADLERKRYRLASQMSQVVL